jgi:hypothetical protein
LIGAKPVTFYSVEFDVKLCDSHDRIDSWGKYCHNYFGHF